MTDISNPPWNVTDTYCGTYTRCTRADVMLVGYAANTWAERKVANVGLGSITVNGTDAFAGITYPFQGMNIEKVGMVSGRIQGTVASTCVDLSVNTPYQYRQLCANQVYAFGASQGGDSGGPVMTPISYGVNPYHYAAGVAFAISSTSASTYYFTDFDEISQALGITIQVN